MNLDNKVKSGLSYSSSRRNRNSVLSNEAAPTSSKSQTSEEKNPLRWVINLPPLPEKKAAKNETTD